MVKLKLFALILLSLNPGAGFASVGDWKRAVWAIGIFVTAGFAHSALASTGPVLFVAGITAMLVIWLAIAWKSIRTVILNSKTAVLWKAVLATVIFVSFSKAGREYFFIGVPYRMQSASMTPVIDKEEHIFVSKLGREYENGDRLLVSVNEMLIVGVLCGKAGQRVEIRNGQVYLDGTESNCIDGIIRDPAGDLSSGGIPDEHVFILNNGILDSSRVGPLKRESIKGKVVFKIRDVPGGRIINTVMGWLAPL